MLAILGSGQVAVGAAATASMHASRLLTVLTSASPVTCAAPGSPVRLRHMAGAHRRYCSRARGRNAGHEARGRESVCVSAYWHVGRVPCVLAVLGTHCENQHLSESCGTGPAQRALRSATAAPGPRTQERASLRAGDSGSRLRRARQRAGARARAHRGDDCPGGSGRRAERAERAGEQHAGARCPPRLPAALDAEGCRDRSTARHPSTENLLPGRV